MADLIPSRRTSSARRGLSAVEAGIVLPVLLLLTMGIIEYGWMFLRVQQVTNAAREGARVAARPDSERTDIEAAVEHVMRISGMGNSDFTLVRSFSYDLPDYLGPLVTITVEVPYANVGLGLAVPTPKTLESSVTMLREGPYNGPGFDP